MASKEKMNLLRLAPERFSRLRNTLMQLEDTCNDTHFGSQLLKDTLFLQFIIFINRNFLGHKLDIQNTDVEFDETIDEILQYINRNLSDDLSVDRLAAICHLSKYYLMHRFKQQTGYTIHNYIVKKRLIAANTLIKEGKSCLQKAVLMRNIS
jgi:AraC-like DNA-binding protein